MLFNASRRFDVIEVKNVGLLVRSHAAGVELGQKSGSSECVLCDADLEAVLAYVRARAEGQG